MTRVSCQDATQTPLWWGVLGRPDSKEAPRISQNPLERLYLSVGLRMPRDPPAGLGQSGTGEGSFPALAAAPVSQPQISVREWMNILGVLKVWVHKRWEWSLDLSPLDFFSWVMRKDKVYLMKITGLKPVRERTSSQWARQQCKPIPSNSQEFLKGHQIKNGGHWEFWEVMEWLVSFRAGWTTHHTMCWHLCFGAWQMHFGQLQTTSSSAITFWHAAAKVCTHVDIYSQDSSGPCKSLTFDVACNGGSSKS